MDKTSSDLVYSWSQVREQYEALRKQEAELRKTIQGLLFPDTMSKATQYVDLGSDWRLKCTGGIEYKVDGDLLGQMISDKLVGPDIMACIKWTPTLIKKNYDALNDNDKATTDSFVTTRPKSITLEIVGPKK